MDVFKERTGIAKVYPITKEVYFRVTGKDRKYCKEDGNGNKSLYAVCPACDNPIQIIGLFKNSAEAGRKPYGRHHKGSIPKLASYHEEDYYDCPYSNPTWRKPGKYRKPGSPLARMTLNLLKAQFDRVIYILSKDMEVKISLDTARRMLRSYLGDEGWLYRTATPYNLPWPFGEVEKALPLFGRKIAVGGGLHEVLRSRCPYVALIPDESGKWAKVTSANGAYVNLHYLLFNHVFEQKHGEDSFDESIIFWVYEGQPPAHKTVFEKKISISIDYFQYLIDLPPERSRRNARLLDIAKEMIP